jgi:hypothetical protein
MGIKPWRIAPDRLFDWILDFLLKIEVKKRCRLLTIKNVLYDCPVEGVEGQNTQFSLVRTVGTQLQQEVCKLWDMFAKNGNFLQIRRKRLVGRT